MSVSDSDSEQNRILAEHTVRIEYLERNMSTLSQAAVDLNQAVATQAENIRHLAASTADNLAAVREQTAMLIKTANNVQWVQRIGWTLIAAAAALAGYWIKSVIGG